MSRPIWSKVTWKWSPKAQWSWAFDLSPITTIEEASGSTVESLAEAETRGESSASFKARRVAWDREERIPPQRSLSEEMMMKSLLGGKEVGGREPRTSMRSVRIYLRPDKNHSFWDAAFSTVTRGPEVADYADFLPRRSLLA